MLHDTVYNVLSALGHDSEYIIYIQNIPLQLYDTQWYTKIEIRGGSLLLN